MYIFHHLVYQCCPSSIIGIAHTWSSHLFILCWIQLILRIKLRKIMSRDLEDCDFLWQVPLNMTKEKQKVIILPPDRPYNTSIIPRQVTNPFPHFCWDIMTCLLLLFYRPLIFFLCTSCHHYCLSNINATSLLQTFILALMIFFFLSKQILRFRNP